MWGDRYIPMSYFDSLADARKSLKENSIKSLEMQTSLLDWLRTTTSVEAYAEFMKVYGYRHVDDPGSRRVMGQWLHGQVKKVAEGAPTYYVSGDMCTMVAQAAVALDVSEGLQPTDMPTNTGFLLFDRPMRINGPDPENPEGEEVMISAILWEHGEVGQRDPHAVGPQDPGTPTATAPGVKYWMFMTPHDSAVVINRGRKADFEKQLREAGFPEPYALIDGDTQQPVEFVTEADVRKWRGPLDIYDFSGWSYGQTWAQVTYDDEEGEGWDEERQAYRAMPVVDQARRIILATWRMLGQKIVNVETNTLPKGHPARRAANRVMPCDGDILIIRLRREYNLRLKLEEMGEEGDHGFLWSHRWIVRGHWRRPKNTALDHPKTEWVTPYIKGPEHLPLVTKEKIFSLEH